MWWLVSIAMAQDEPITLKVWHAYRDAEAEVFESILQDYDRSNPAIELDILQIAYDAYSSKLESAIPRQNGPDVFIYAHEKIGSWSQSNLIQPLRLEESLVHPITVDAVRFNNAVYGAPLAVKCLVMFRNIQLLDVAPKSTDELMALSKTLPKDIIPLAYPATDAYFHMPWLYGYGGSLFDENQQSTLNDKSNAASLDFIKKMDDAELLPKEPDAALVTHLFNQGEAALAINGPWFLSSIDAGIQYDVHPLPIVSETGKPASPLLTVEAAFISSQTTNVRASQALVDHLLTNDVAARRAREARQVITTLSVLNSPIVNDDPILSVFKTQMNNSVPTPNIPQMSSTWEPLARAVRRVHRGSMNGKQALEEAWREYSIYTKPAPPAANPIPYIIVALLGLITAIGIGIKQARKYWPEITNNKHAYLYVAPAAIAMTLLTAIPFLVGAIVSLFSHHQGEFTFVGLANFVDLLFAQDWSVTSSLSFYFTLVVTIGWTIANLILHVGIGLGMALLLREPWLKLKGFYRVLLIVPWAIPNYITALIWRGMFKEQASAINILLDGIGLAPDSWFSQFSTSFTANLITNTWLGFPFMMVVSLGALQSIPRDLEDAAEVDGATGWQRFWHITLPMLKPALLPAIVLGSVWTFNMFNIIYLVSAGEPDSSTDILISDAYRWAFSRGNRYGYASAYAVLIFFILLGYSKLGNKIAGQKTL